jgi:hypothetical protein
MVARRRHLFTELRRQLAKRKGVRDPAKLAAWIKARTRGNNPLLYVDRMGAFVMLKHGAVAGWIMPALGRIGAVAEFGKGTKVALLTPAASGHDGDALYRELTRNGWNVRLDPAMQVEERHAVAALERGQWRGANPLLAIAGANPGPRGTFEEWRSVVDAAVQGKAGLSLDDLEDAPLYDWYEAGVSPKAAAGKAIRRSGGEGFNPGRRRNPGRKSHAKSVRAYLASLGAKHGQGLLLGGVAHTMSAPFELREDAEGWLAQAIAVNAEAGRAAAGQVLAVMAPADTVIPAHGDFEPGAFASGLPHPLPRGGNPGGRGRVFGRQVEEVKYHHVTEGPRVHTFTRKGTRMAALPDGSVRIFNPNAPVWEED